MMEDHKDNLQAINTFKIQQKQNYWERMLDQDTSLKTTGPKYINKRSQIRSQEFTKRPVLQSRPQTNHTNMTTQVAKSQIMGSLMAKSQNIFITKKASVSSLKKKTIYYQAHPNFPLIKDVYQESEYKLLE